MRRSKRKATEAPEGERKSKAVIPNWRCDYKGCKDVCTLLDSTLNRWFCNAHYMMKCIKCKKQQIFAEGSLCVGCKFKHLDACCVCNKTGVVLTQLEEPYCEDCLPACDNGDCENMARSVSGSGSYCLACMPREKKDKEIKCARDDCDKKFLHEDAFVHTDDEERETNYCSRDCRDEDKKNECDCDEEIGHGMKCNLNAEWREKTGMDPICVACEEPDEECTKFDGQWYCNICHPTCYFVDCNTQASRGDAMLPKCKFHADFKHCEGQFCRNVATGEHPDRGWLCPGCAKGFDKCVGCTKYIYEGASMCAECGPACSSCKVKKGTKTHEDGRVICTVCYWSDSTMSQCRQVGCHTVISTHTMGVFKCSKHNELVCAVCKKAPTHRTHDDGRILCSGCAFADETLRTCITDICDTVITKPAVKCKKCKLLCEVCKTANGRKSIDGDDAHLVCGDCFWKTPGMFNCLGLCCTSIVENKAGYCSKCKLCQVCNKRKEDRYDHEDGRKICESCVEYKIGLSFCLTDKCNTVITQTGDDPEVYCSKCKLCQVCKKREAIKKHNDGRPICHECFYADEDLTDCDNDDCKKIVNRSDRVCSSCKHLCRMCFKKQGNGDHEDRGPICTTCYASDTNMLACISTGCKTRITKPSLFCKKCTVSNGRCQVCHKNKGTHTHEDRGLVCLECVNTDRTMARCMIGNCPTFIAESATKCRKCTSEPLVKCSYTKCNVMVPDRKGEDWLPVCDNHGPKCKAEECKTPNDEVNAAGYCYDHSFWFDKEGKELKCSGLDCEKETNTRTGNTVFCSDECVQKNRPLRKFQCDTCRRHAVGFGCHCEDIAVHCWRCCTQAADGCRKHMKTVEATREYFKTSLGTWT